MPNVVTADKVFFLVKKKPDSSWAEFTEHWLHNHGKLLSNSCTYRRYRSQYVQNHLVTAGVPCEHPFLFDGITEVWVHPLSSTLPPLQETQEYQRVIRPDEAKMLDREQCVVLRAVEHDIVPGTAAYKVMTLVRRRPDVSPADFSDFWSGEYKDVLLAQPEFRGLLRGYRQNHLVGGACTTMTGRPLPEGAGFDGVIEMWFDSAADAERAYLCDGYRTTVLDHARAAFVLDKGKEGASCAVTEHLIFDKTQEQA